MLMPRLVLIVAVFYFDILRSISSNYIVFWMYVVQIYTRLYITLYIYILNGIYDVCMYVMYVGELCLMFRQDVLPYVGRLLPIIIGHILDASNVKKQEIAVKTLGIFIWFEAYLCLLIVMNDPILYF
jgi:hypothetical protein